MTRRLPSSEATEPHHNRCGIYEAIRRISVHHPRLRQYAVPTRTRKLEPSKPVRSMHPTDNTQCLPSPLSWGTTFPNPNYQHKHTSICPDTQNTYYGSRTHHSIKSINHMKFHPPWTPPTPLTYGNLISRTVFFAPWCGAHCRTRLTRRSKSWKGGV